MAVHAADVGACNSHQRVFDGNTSCVFGFFNCLLDASHCLVEFRDHAFAQATRFTDAVSTIAQAVFADFGDQHASLGAADVNRGNEIGRLAGHGDR